MIMEKVFKGGVFNQLMRASALHPSAENNADNPELDNKNVHMTPVDVRPTA
jgi:hypothetical protein